MRARSPKRKRGFYSTSLALRAPNRSAFRVSILRRGHASTGCYLDARTPQALLQRRQHREHRPRPAVVAHEADAPDLALEVAEPAADFDAELGQHAFANRQIVNALRNEHRVK